MKRLFTLFFLLAVSAVSAKQTTATLIQEYREVEQRISEDQKTLLRLEGAIRILEINAASETTHTTSTKTKQ